MYKVAIIGASGYTGGELLRMLLNHPEVEVTDITSRQYDGTPAHKIHPHIRDSGLVFKNKEPDELDADVVFTATPHGASMKIVPRILDTGAKVVDLSGDYRYRDTAVYEKWYGMEHTDKENKGAFGLPELYRDEIKKAKLVANPGCFPTGAILSSYPLVKNDFVDRIIIDSKPESAVPELTRAQPRITRTLQITLIHTKLVPTDTCLKFNRNCMALKELKYHLRHTWFRSSEESKLQATAS